MKYLIRKYQVFYDDGSRDKVILWTPILSSDIETTRAKLTIKHTCIGKACKGVNIEYEEINSE